MRILTKKIYRAYPELDKFDDEACKRFITRAKQRHGAWKGNAFLAFILVASFILWIPLAVLFIYLGKTLTQTLGYSGGLQMLYMLAIFTGMGWFPAICFLLARDRLLHLSIRKQLSQALCSKCGYSLLGLKVIDQDGQQAVQCPECGQTITLKDLDLSQEDLDPNLVTSS